MKERWREEFSEWYNEILDKAEVLDIRYPVKGLYVWRPYGFQIRRRVLEVLRGLLDETGHQEALFPLLVPEDEFAKEAAHIKGFEDEVYWVTHGGLEPLHVKLALRPTSETAIYPMFAVWIRSHTDMPLKLYQIVSTFRYETKHTRPLIRLREITTFKEAHTAHASAEEAEAQVREAIDVYRRFFDLLGIPYLVSRRPDWDKFPGADYTMAFDTLFPDGRTLQIGTVHNLGQTFSKTFDVRFENREGGQEYAYQTCYGISDRVIASLLVVHGDDRGLCLPPLIAPIQCVLIPIWYKEGGEEVDREVEGLERELEGLRIHVDRRDVRPGSKFFDWEIRGVPLRMEIGPRDVREGQVTVVRRDTGEKLSLPRGGIRERIEGLLSEIAEGLKRRSWKEFRSRCAVARNLEEARGLFGEMRGIVSLGWCGKEGCAKEIEESLALEILGTLEEGAEGDCAACRKAASFVLVMGRAY
jgi:prolyl-tRNA synthetase